MFKIVGQAGVFPPMYPNSAKMALGWPRCTQIVAKWHLDGQVAGSGFFSTRVRHDTQKKSPFSPAANLGGFGLLRNRGKRMFQIMGQAGVFSAMNPNSSSTIRAYN